MTDILRDISVKQENGDNVSWCRSVGHPRRAQRGRMNWVRPVEQASCPYCLSRLARIRRSVAKRKKWNCVWRRRSWHWRSCADDVTYLLERLLRSDVVGRKSVRLAGALLRRDDSLDKIRSVRCCNARNYSTPDKEAVSLFVCPRSYLRNYTSDLHKFLCLLPMAVARSTSVMYFRFYGWRHVCS